MNWILLNGNLINLDNVAVITPLPDKDTEGNSRIKLTLESGSETYMPTADYEPNTIIANLAPLLGIEPVEINEDS